MKVASGHLGIRKPRIEMLPLIDIVFLLLVFFIYAMLSMAVHRSLPVYLPVSATAPRETAESLAVTVRKNGDLFLDAVPLTLEEMGAALRDKAQKGRSGGGQKVMVTLFADKDISYQELYTILDVIRSAGIEDVSLQADARK
jgi:biopolymer transport protein ExbD